MSSVSLGLFAKRDTMTVISSFILPDMMTPKLMEMTKMAESTANYSCQLVTPIAMQILSTPIHLLGLDIYNRGDAISTQDRIAFIKKEYFKTLAARMSRILPAFGLGGVINIYLRKQGVEFLNSQKNRA